MTDPRLVPAANAIRRIITGAPVPADHVHIREETIDRVIGDGRATIRGYADVLPPKSPTLKLAPGQRVHVMFRGPVPKLILGHHWKRAQPGGVPVDRYAVEELFLYEAATEAPAGAQWDVYFRNDQQVTRLNLHEIINADRQTTWDSGTFGTNETGAYRVGWGQADNTFWVMAFAHSGTTLADSLWWPRFYTFRLSRAEGVPAGATTVTATLMALVDMPVFELPNKYGSFGPVVATPTFSPATFPYLWSSGVGPSISPLKLAQAILQRDGKIVMVMPYVSVNGYATSLTLPVVEQVTYLFAVRSDEAAILWESPTTDAYRDSPPLSALGISAVDTPYTAYQVRLWGFSVLEWGADVGTARRVVASWDAVAAHDTNIAPRVFTLVHAKRSVLIEDGTATPAAIQPWTDYQASNTGGGVTAVEPTPLRLIMAGGPDGRALLYGERYTSVSPNVFEARIELWDGAAFVLEALDADALADPALSQRVQALRLLGAGTVYTVAENAATAAVGAWPAVGERGRFTLLAGDTPLDVGEALQNDGAHQGPLVALPVGLTEVDALAAPHRLAYHVVGTIT